MFNYTTSIITTLTAVCAVLANAQKYPTGDAVFKSSEMKHFRHVDILAAFPVNSSTTYLRNATQAPTMGGTRLWRMLTLTKRDRERSWRH